MWRYNFHLAIVFFALSSSACSNQNEAGKKAKLALESRLTDSEQRQVVAVIGERVLTLRDLERQLNAQRPLLRDQYGNAQRKLLFLKELVRTHLLANEAIKLGIDKDPVVQESLSMLLAEALVEDLGRAALRSEPISESEVQAMGKAEGVAPDDLDSLSKLRQRQVRLRKEAAVQRLLETNQSARDITFDAAAWSNFQNVYRAEEGK